MKVRFVLFVTYQKHFASEIREVVASFVREAKAGAGCEMCLSLDFTRTSTWRIYLKCNRADSLYLWLRGDGQQVFTALLNSVGVRSIDIKSLGVNESFSLVASRTDLEKRVAEGPVI